MVDLKAPTELSLALSMGTITVLWGHTTIWLPMTPLPLVAAAPPGQTAAGRGAHLQQVSRMVVAPRCAAISRSAWGHTAAVHAAGREQHERRDQPRAMPGVVRDGRIEWPGWAATRLLVICGIGLLVRVLLLSVKFARPVAHASP